MTRRARRARDLIAAIDIGASKVACVIAEAAPIGDGGCEPDVVGVGQHGAIVSERAGDIEASLRAAVEAAERMAGERIASAHVAAPGRTLGCRRIGVDLDVSGGCVTAEDVESCLAEGARAASADGSASLHAFPVRFQVDGEPAPDGPEGLFGDVLSAEVLGVSVRESFAANVEALLNRCGLELDALVAAPYAAAEAVLIDDEKDLGVLMLDLGARSTTFALYERGALSALGGVPLGGEHVTRDIAQIFGAPLGVAERIKALHGSALVGTGDEHRLLDVPQLGDPGEVARHSRAELASVIAPRLEEIFELALEALPQRGGSRSALRRVVLTGGGSLLVGARETAERLFGVKARVGRPAALLGAPEAVTAPQFATALGVLRHVAAERAIENGKRRAPMFDRVAGAELSSLGLIGQVGAWLKANF